MGPVLLGWKLPLRDWELFLLTKSINCDVYNKYHRSRTIIAQVAANLKLYERHAFVFCEPEPEPGIFRPLVKIGLH